MTKLITSRRGLLRCGYRRWSRDANDFYKALFAAYLNEPKGSTVTLGFNVPQTGPYADEGADELRAYLLAVEHLNGEGDGGMMNTLHQRR